MEGPVGGCEREEMPGKIDKLRDLLGNE